MGLLGYLVPRIAASGAEPAATQALAYLLNSSSDIAQAFVDAVGWTGIEPFTPGRTLAEEKHGRCIPDLTIRDEGGEVRIFVENKFWAGLMEGQPVAYLKELPNAAAALLIFVVPHTRMYGLWNELKEKCRQSKVALTDEDPTGAIYWAKAHLAGGASGDPGTGNTTNAIYSTIAITSWKHVLGTLEQAADAKGHADLRADIVQLRGLTDRMDADEFLPLREGEVTDVDVARRMINYTGLIDEIVSRLKADGVADTKKLKKGLATLTPGASLDCTRDS